MDLQYERGNVLSKGNERTNFPIVQKILEGHIFQKILLTSYRTTNFDFFFFFVLIFLKQEDNNTA